MKNKYTISWLDFLGSYLKGTKFFYLRELVRKSEAESLGVGFSQLETHLLAGGRPDSVINGLVYAKEIGFSLSWDEGCALDLVLGAGKKGTVVLWLKALKAEGFSSLEGAPLPV